MDHYARWVMLGLWLAAVATPLACGVALLRTKPAASAPRRFGGETSPVGNVLDYETPQPAETSAVLTAFAWTSAALPALVTIGSLAVMAEVYLRLGRAPRPFLDRLPQYGWVLVIPTMISFALPLIAAPVVIAFAAGRPGRQLLSRSAAWALVVYGAFSLMQIYPAGVVVGWVVAN